MYRQLTNNTVQEQYRPEISGNLLIYTVQPTISITDTSQDVFLFDLANNVSTPLAVSNPPEYAVDIFGNLTLVYDKGTLTSKLILTNGTSFDLPREIGRSAAIDGNNIVFADTRNNNIIGLYNIQSQGISSFNVNNPSPKYDFAMSGDNIVYRIAQQIWTVSTSGNNPRLLTSTNNIVLGASAPKISGDNVVFREDIRLNGKTENYIQLYNLTTNTKRTLPIVNRLNAALSQPDISGNIVASFGNDPTNGEIALYACYTDGSNLTRLTTKDQVRVASAVSIWGNNAVWSDLNNTGSNYELYNATIAIDPLFRFYNPASRGHFFTTSTQERDIVFSNPDWGYRYEGIGLKSSITPGADLNPVYRFYNPISRGHFFTIDPKEKDVIFNNPDWGYRYEGTPFYAFGLGSNQGTEVYRFYNGASRGHFFTASTAERDTVFANPDWGYRYEGVAFRGYL